MTTTLTVAPYSTTDRAPSEPKARSLERIEMKQNWDNLVVLASSKYLLTNLSTIRDANTSGPELTRAFKRVATQIVAQGGSLAG